MENFKFNMPTRIIFGKGSENEAADEIRKYGQRVLLHYGSNSIRKSGVYDKIVSILQASAINFIELSGVLPNPRLSLVYEGIRICKENHIDFILAVGGGSVIDSAKAIAAGACYEGDVWDFYTGRAEAQQTLPLGVILTIPAAGSEASNGTVVTNENGWYKRAFGTELLRPKFAALNPEFTYTLSNYQTACGVADIMAHIMERYFTNTRAVDLTDRLCEATLKTVIKYAPIVLKNPTDYDSRAEIMWAGTLAHNDLLGTGRSGDWASHNIEHELSGLYDVAHGAGLATVFPAWMNYVYKHDINRFAQFANRVWDVEYAFEAPERTALAGIERLKAFFREIGMPVTLGELGVPDDRLEEMAAKSTQDGPLGNFVELGKEDVLNILRLAR